MQKVSELNTSHKTIAVDDLLITLFQINRKLFDGINEVDKNDYRLGIYFLLNKKVEFFWELSIFIVHNIIIFLS